METTFEGAPLAREDAARLWMDTRENPMIVTAVLELDGELELDELAELVERRLLGRASRFASRVATCGGLLHDRAVWASASSRGRDYVSVVRRGVGRTLEEVVAEVGRTLDPRRSAWHTWLVGDDARPAGSALVVRAHHVLADGAGLLAVLAAFSDEGPAPRSARSPLPSPSGRARVSFGRAALSTARAFGRLALPGAQPPAPLARAPGGPKRYAWTNALDVEAVRRASHALGGHVNDLVLGALAGALRRWLARRSPPPRAPLRVLVPVAMPHADGALGNHYASTFVELPVHLEDGIERVRAARAAMAEARAGVALGRTLVGAAGALGASVERAGVHALSRRVAVVASNLVGPSSRVHLGGREIRSIVYAAPAPGRVAVSVSAFGYAGGLTLTVASDVRAMPCPRELASDIERELASLV